MTDLQCEFEDLENPFVSTCGSLEVAFAYDAPMRKMTIHMLQARDIPSKERGGASHSQVEKNRAIKSPVLLIDRIALLI